MALQGIGEALRKHPFEPFSIRLRIGRPLPIPHRDFTAVGNRRIVVLALNDS